MRSLFNGDSREIRSPQIRQRWLKFSAFLLVMVILISMVLGVSGVVRGMNTTLAYNMLVFGLLAGWGLVRFGQRGWSSALLTFFAGLLMSAMVVGRLWDDWQALWNNLIWWFGTAWQAFVRTLQGQLTYPSIGTLLLDILDFTNGVYVMFQRFFLWIIRFPRMNNDLLSILMVWSMLFWVAVVWAAWFLWKRGRPLEGVIPAFLVVAVARSYSNASSNVMLVMLGATIALMILTAQIDREQDWVARGIGYSELIRKNSTQAAMVLSIILVFVSGTITAVDIDKLRERWEDFTRKRQTTSVSSPGVSSSLGIKPAGGRETLAEQFNKLSRGGLPSSHLVGSGPDLSEEVVLVARVEETDPVSGNPISVDAASQTYYFRSLTFDKYTSQGWFSNGGRIYSYQPGQEAITTYTSRQRLIKQDVRYENRISTINKVYVVGELAVVDRLYNAFWRQGESLSEFQDVFGATFDGWSYAAYSIVPVFSEDDLRDSSLDYPGWVLSRFLQLPDTVPDRVINMAYELTSQELTAYDKAVAIEQYLRTFPYTLDLPIKAASIDIADYFLFDAKRGYCDYYASTMVVLARAAGIPARLAVGYLGGTYDEENDYYVITADQAHTWVEVYFPEYGWVTFEPTAGRPALARETEKFNLPEFERKITFTEERLPLSGLEILLWSVGGFIAALVLGFLIWLRMDIFVLRWQPIDKAFARIYRRLLWFGRRMGVHRGIAQTPLEFSAEMNERITHLRAEHPTLGYLEKTGRTLESLVALANKAAYSAETADAFERARAVDFWIVLRRQLGLAIVWNWFFNLLPRRQTEEKMVG